jgi:hypothetical protein
MQVAQDLRRSKKRTLARYQPERFIPSGHCGDSERTDEVPCNPSQRAHADGVERGEGTWIRLTRVGALICSNGPKMPKILVFLAF